jgi:FkbM family methyltransferase
MYEEQIVGKLSSLLKPGMTFLDVGANIGLHTTVAANRVGAAGRVLAIEPQKGPWVRLQENIALNNLNNVTVVRCALGSTEGSMQLFKLSDTNSGMATLAIGRNERPVGSETVDVKRLSTVAEAAGIRIFDAVKIDVEGAELDVLAGAADFFGERWPQFIVVECVDHHLRRFKASSSALVSFLRAKGYTVYSLRRGRWITVDSAEGLSADLLALRTS